ncbi:unnamed protein product [Kluyveromyces dobzhanskii CBS 2104]|uniref:non-specific serine/threonine protein kinase n=1 Tax=Kluyveromyces dobzhanskii CBS 2104 TaxID=1427455 RepID=A0A0A8L8X4_9SACH|nr:unnamed protein product [Kluyveromyces dobzhanskii CBS 2104]
MNQPQIEKYSPGTVLPVGSHQVKVLKYLASGGFAHVYSVEISPPDLVCPDNIACLKRVVVPDKTSLNTLRAEVDSMKSLRGNKCIVSYIDSHATKSPMNAGMYEVYLLMEFCSGGGLIDFMNTRLQNRLQESEILNIMSQVSQGVAAMHALQPPLIHRDIKIENVLLSKTNDFKLCDFGSVSGVIRAPRNTEEFNYVQYDIMKNTTAQYRCPEMIDLYRGLPIDEKADIWALGVFLYKVCYYTTPFEKNGESAILASKFQFPAYPHYSDRIKNLISVMLRVEPLKRPNICQVLEEVSRIQGIPCPIKNFYLLRMMEKQDYSRASPSPQLPPGTIQAVEQKLSHPPKIATNANITSKPASFQQMPQLHLSKSQPLSGQLEVAPHIQPLGRTATLANPIYRSSDPFSKLDKSALLSTSITMESIPSVSRTPQLEHLQMPHMSKSHAVLQRNSVSPVRNGRGAISSIVASNKTSLDRGRYVDSETQTSDYPIGSLSRSASRKSFASSISSTESLEAISTGGSFTRKIGSKIKKVMTGDTRGFSPIKSAQNTGESVKSAFSALRKGISSIQLTGDNSTRKTSAETRKYRNTSNNSIPENKISSSKSHRRSTSFFSFVPENNDYELVANIKKEKRPAALRRTSSLKGSSSSIQKRVKDLINAEDVPNKSSTSGYGKYTDTARAINPSNQLENTANRKSSTVITPIHDLQKSKPVPPPKPAHLKPTLPPKPKHLKAKSSEVSRKKSGTQKRDSRQNLEDSPFHSQHEIREFERRFPSAL